METLSWGALDSSKTTTLLYSQRQQQQQNQRHSLQAPKQVSISNTNKNNKIHVFNSEKIQSFATSDLQHSSTSLLVRNTSNPREESDIRLGLSSNEDEINVSVVHELVRKYSDSGLYEDVIRLYVHLLHLGFPVDGFLLFPCLVKAYGEVFGDVKCGRVIHGHLIKLGSLCDFYVKNSILGMYWKFGAIEDVVMMFEKMGERDLVSWNTMVSGFCQSGEYVKSLVLFGRMIEEFGGGVCLNRVACLSAISSCGAIEFLGHGRQIHGFIMKNGLDSDEFIASGLIDMYMKCGDVTNAECIFEKSLDDDLVRVNKVVWNAMIWGYINNEYLSLSFKLFVRMLESEISPDSSTVVAALVLCPQLLDLEFGKQMHGICISSGLENDTRVATALMNMYFRCGDPETGLTLFWKSKTLNSVMWGSVISNCAQNGYSAEALQLFLEFMIGQGHPDEFILLAVLRACSSSAVRSNGMEVHGLMMKSGFESDVFIGSALVDFYAKCGDMESAQKGFNRLSSRDLVSWNALISGCAQNEYGNEALSSFRKMQTEQVKPNAVTLACVLSSCTHLSAMTLCKEVHCYLLRNGLETNVLVSNSLICTYSKCGNIKSSRRIFDNMPIKDEISWNSILLGFGTHGLTNDMFATLENMKNEGIKPDHASFTALLSACSHTGNVEMGWKCFHSMLEDYNLKPKIEQYTCMVDLLGRAGHLNEAYDLIVSMPCTADDRIWGSLLGSCKIHGEKRLAEFVASHIFELDPTNIGYRVLLANFYEDLGNQNDGSRVRSEISNMGLKKLPGCSWIEINNNVHVFTAGDFSHSKGNAVYAMINSLTMETKRAG